MLSKEEKQKDASDINKVEVCGTAGLVRILYFLMAVAAENPEQFCGFTVPCLTLSVGRLTSKNIVRNVPLCRNPLSESVPVMDRMPHNSTPCQLQEAGSSSGLKVNVSVAQRVKKKLKALEEDKSKETVTTAIDRSWSFGWATFQVVSQAIIDEQ